MVGDRLIRLGVTGTDTGVGKTVVASAICALLREQGHRVAPMKPVETGVGALESGDAGRLRAAAGSALALSVLSPIRLPDPLAPFLAAERVGRPIDLTVLDAAYHEMASTHDVVIVEGAGGLLVPLTDAATYDTLMARWQLDVIIVTANRLGAVNHTLLTLAAASVPVRGIVLNTVSSAAAGLAEATNAEFLARLVSPVPVRTFPYLPDPEDPARLAREAVKAGFEVFWEP